MSLETIFLGLLAVIVSGFSVWLNGRNSETTKIAQASSTTLAQDQVDKNKVIEQNKELSNEDLDKATIDE